MQDIIGEASAGTLGYILGDRRGSNLARRLFRTYRKRMAPTGRSRSRGRTRSPRGVLATPQSTLSFQSTNPFRSRSGRRAPRSSSRSTMSISGRSIASTIRSADSTNVVQKANKRKGTKVHKEGLKKRVKVPKKLRKQVKQILENKGPVGSLMEIKSQKITPTDGQSVFMLGNTSENQPNLFDPCYIQYVASTLFNGAAATQTPLIGNAGFFSPRTLRVEVIKQSVTYRVKNNTARTFTLKFLDLSPKSRNFGNGFNPLTFWTAAFQQEGTANSPNNPNVYNINPLTLYAHPKMSDAFKNLYEVDETIVYLEPGKDYIHKLNGPNKKLYDYQKFWSGSSPTAGVFDNQQKFIKQTMLIIIPDLTSTTGGQAGRYVDIPAAPGPYGICMEQTTYTKIHMPEQAGFAWPTVTPTTGNQPLNKRMRVYAINDFTPAQAGTVAPIEDENPSEAIVAGSG